MYVCTYVCHVYTYSCTRVLLVVLRTTTSTVRVQSMYSTQVYMYTQVLVLVPVVNPCTTGTGYSKVDT